MDKMGLTTSFDELGSILMYEEEPTIHRDGVSEAAGVEDIPVAQYPSASGRVQPPHSRVSQVTTAERRMFISKGAGARRNSLQDEKPEPGF